MTAPNFRPAETCTTCAHVKPTGYFIDVGLCFTCTRHGVVMNAPQLDARSHVCDDWQKP